MRQAMLLLIIRAVIEEPTCSYAAVIEALPTASTRYPAPEVWHSSLLTVTRLCPPSRAPGVIAG
jgi:hypothetical protein